MTDPVYGGVSASLALLGDLNIAEPGARAGFAGPGIIEQTIRQKLPEGFQRSEYLLDKGMVDMVVDRRKLKTTVATLLSVLMHKRAAVQGDSGETTDFVEATVEELPKGKRKQPKQAAPPTAKAAE